MTLRGFEKLPTGLGPGWRQRHRYDVESLLESLVHGSVAEDGPLHAAFPKRILLLGAIDADAVRVELAEGPAVVERFEGGDRAQTVFETSHRLRAFGLEGPRVLGFVGLDDRSLVVSEWARGPTLKELIEAGVLGDSQERRRVGHVAASALRALHARGFVHGGIGPGRWVVSETGLMLGRLDRVRRSRRADHRLRDLLSIDVMGGRTERLAWLSTYVGPRPDRRAQRRWWMERIAGASASR